MTEHMNVSVLGLGYVGAVAAACLAETGHNVFAFDKNPLRAAHIREGRAPVTEPGLTALVSKTVAQGRLHAVLTAAEAVAKSDISLICVGTPGGADGRPVLDDVIGACRIVGGAMKAKKTRHTVVLRSTVPPGTARNIAIPEIEAASGLKCGRDFGFACNPEFLREASAIRDYFNPPMIVIGSACEQSMRDTAALYRGIAAERVFTTPENAESVKYVCNAWHAHKVAFANEIGNILKPHGVDSHAVMDIFCRDRQLNISEAYLKPGFAFGGSCLPKDLRALRAAAAAHGVPTPLIDAVLEANEEQVRRAFDMIKRSGKRKVTLLGLAFKPGTDDLRESPLVTLANLLMEGGFELSVFDPFVARDNALIGPVGACLVDTVRAGAEVVVVGSRGGAFEAALRDSANDNASIIDLARVKNALDFPSYEGICW